MGILGRLFGTDKALKETSKTVNNVFDTVASGIGNAWYTKQERAMDGLKAGELVYKTEQLRVEALKILWQNNNAGSALSRRIIATMFSSVYLILLLVAVGLRLFGADADSKFVFDVVEKTLVTPIIAILGYYFFHGVTNTVGGALKMFKKPEK